MSKLLPFAKQIAKRAHIAQEIEGLSSVSYAKLDDIIHLAMDLVGSTAHIAEFIKGV